MKIIFGFILGLLVGATGLYFYNRSVITPALVEETRTQAKAEVKEQIEQDIAQASLLISGIVTERSGDELTLEVQESNGLLVKYNIQAGANTVISRLKNDETSTKESITLEDIAIGNRVSVITSEPVDSLNIYAVEIVAL